MNLLHEKKFENDLNLNFVLYHSVLKVWTQWKKVELRSISCSHLSSIKSTPRIVTYTYIHILPESLWPLIPEHVNVSCWCYTVGPFATKSVLYLYTYTSIRDTAPKMDEPKRYEFMRKLLRRYHKRTREINEPVLYVLIRNTEQKISTSFSLLFCICQLESSRFHFTGSSFCARGKRV